MSETWIAACSVVGGVPFALDAAELVTIIDGASVEGDLLDIADVLSVDASGEVQRRCVTVDPGTYAGAVMLGEQIWIVELPSTSRIDPPEFLARAFATNKWSGLALIDDELRLILTIPGLIVVRDQATGDATR